jgi:hypothetical protein
MNPKCMKPTIEHGYSYCIDIDAQVFVIGYSEEYSVCKYVSTVDSRQCTTFLNKSAENLCETHRLL